MRFAYLAAVLAACSDRASVSGDDRLAQDRACAECHADIASEQRRSIHAASFVNAAYQRARQVEPLAFCDGCHAPEGDPHAGVSCVSCHVTDGRVRAAWRPGELRRPAPHPLERSESFASADACARCHEFQFPDRDARDAPEWMQLTVTEHAQSDLRDRSCADCHMPRVTGPRGVHRSHAFASTRSELSLRRAVRVRAQRHAGQLRLELATHQVGHAFPTGDLFRRLAVEAEAIGIDHALIGQRRIFLARHFADQRQASGALVRVQIGDDRLGAPGTDRERVVFFDFGGAAAGASLLWRVRYERVQHLRAGREELAVVANRVILAEGKE